MAKRLTFNVPVDLFDGKWIVDLEHLHEECATTGLRFVSRTSVSRAISIAGYYFTIEFTTTEALTMFRSVDSQLSELGEETHVPASTPAQG